MTIADSIIKYAASDKMDSGAWEELVMETHAVLTLDELELVLKNAEQEFKERTGETAMPTRWRSAKSVIITARTHSVTVVGENGKPLGKTAIEKMIKVIKEGSKMIASPSDIAEKGLDLIAKAYNMCETEVDKIAIQTYVELHLPELWR